MTRLPRGAIPASAMVNDARPIPWLPSSLPINAWLRGFQDLILLESDINSDDGPLRPSEVLVGDVLNAHNDPAWLIRWAAPGGAGEDVSWPFSFQTTWLSTVT